MISRFLGFEWKSFFRSSYFGKGIAIKILLGFFALYFLLSFLGLGVGGYYFIKKTYPNQDPLQFVNGLLLFAIIGDLIFRYLMQKLPVMNIKPLLALPIKKSKLVNYVLTKSGFSFFNIMGLFFYIPFAIVLLIEGYNSSGVIAWLLAMFLIILCANYLNFLINKNNTAFWILAILLGGTIALQYFKIYDFTGVSKLLFNGLYTNPIFAIIPLIVLIVLYKLNFTQLSKQIYLDAGISVKTKQATSSDLSFVDKLGDLAPFIKNDMRQIWRNKRVKTVFLMSFLFLFYGLIFFNDTTYEEKMPAMLIFASLFVTGGFTMNYGQFIPAWESSYYKMIMSQNIRYRKFLESKWLLMVAVTFVFYILSIPYLYFGIDKFLMISAGAIFNIGFNSLFLLWAGSFNRKPIDLNASGFGNMQGTGATQFLIIIPIMGIPMLLFWVFNKYVSFNASIVAIAMVGILGLLFKNHFMNLIEKKYIKDKYATIHAFNKKS